MLHSSSSILRSKIKQIWLDDREVSIFLKDPERFIERVRILDVEGDLITLRYDTEDEEEISSWEEMICLGSIASVLQQLSSVPKGDVELLVSDDCPEAERVTKYPSSDPDPD